MPILHPSHSAALNLARKQYGQAMVETVVIIFVTLLLLLGIIQFGLIYSAKTTLNYAVFEAARAGSLNYADRDAIEYALARGLAPLYTSISQSDSTLDKVQAVQTARDEVLDEIRIGDYACIERINPTDEMFQAHGIFDSSIGFTNGTQRVIPSDNLIYRSSRPKANASIQDANLLKLRVTYCYPMYVPLISNTIKRLMGVMADPDPVPGWTAPTLGAFQTNCYQNDRFPIVAQGIMRMQTPAKNDTFVKDCN